MFVTQVPDPPFGISVYLGDPDTGRNGHAHGTFVGRFSVETFAVAPGVAPAPVVFNRAFPDASTNPATNPVQLYHLGSVVQLAERRRRGRVPGHGNAVQRRARCGASRR